MDGGWDFDVGEGGGGVGKKTNLVVFCVWSGVQDCCEDWDGLSCCCGG